MISKWSLLLGVCLILNTDVYVTGSAVEQMLADDPGSSNVAVGSDAVATAEENTINGNQVCKPNDIKMEACNRCKCSPNGIGWFCTRLACPPKVTTTETTPAVGDGTTQNDTTTCVPGTTFKKDCNTCHCNANGVADCTEIACAQQLPEQSTDPTEKQCTPGETFQMDCNTCFCTDTGVVACTLKGCIHGDLALKLSTRSKRSTEKKCRSGVSFMRDCNKCSCTGTGYELCTTRICDPEMVKREISGPALDIYSPFFQCSPGKEFMSTEGCSCKCLTSGKTAFCDRDDCKPTIAHGAGKHNLYRHIRSAELIREKRQQNKGVCTPGEPFQHADKCNSCICGSTGRKEGSLCTLKLCERLKRSTELVREKRQQNQGVCTPGESFKHADKCNSCVCGQNGRKEGSLCTLKLCLGNLRKKRSEPSSTSCTPGKSFAHSDGCNSCMCPPSGNAAMAACTARYCISARPKRSDDSCEPGETFIASDKCNECHCGPDRKKSTAQCTRKACISPNAADTCNPGESFMDKEGCNTCICPQNGLKSGAACTLKFCLVTREKREASAATCTPGEPFLDREGCNTCICPSNGNRALAACTLKLCFGGKMKRSNDLAVNSADACVRGSQFTAADGCNKCSCTTGLKSQAPCTLLLCPETPRPKRSDDSCTPGDNFPAEDKCNLCRCGPDGKRSKAGCTRKICLNRKKRETDDSCVVGSSFTAADGCNTCTCSLGKKSLALCTIKECTPIRTKRETKDPDAKNFQCTPGSQFHHVDTCNTCICSTDGRHASCTLRECLPNKKPQVEDLSSTYNDMKCVPGSTFKSDDGCNTCFCSKDGQKVGCTLMFCAPTTPPTAFVPVRPALSAINFPNYKRDKQ